MKAQAISGFFKGSGGELPNFDSNRSVLIFSTPMELLKLGAIRLNRHQEVMTQMSKANAAFERLQKWGDICQQAQRVNRKTDVYHWRAMAHMYVQPVAHPEKVPLRSRLRRAKGYPIVQGIAMNGANDGAGSGQRSTTWRSVSGPSGPSTWWQGLDAKLEDLKEALEEAPKEQKAPSRQVCNTPSCVGDVG